MKRFRTSIALIAATTASIMFPLLAAAHPGHDHGDIPSVIRHPFAGGEHLAVIAALSFAIAGAVLLVIKARHASSRHGARARFSRLH